MHAHSLSPASALRLRRASLKKASVTAGPACSAAARMPDSGRCARRCARVRPQPVIGGADFIEVQQHLPQQALDFPGSDALEVIAQPCQLRSDGPRGQFAAQSCQMCIDGRAHRRQSHQVLDPAVPRSLHQFIHADTREIEHPCRIHLHIRRQAKVHQQGRAWASFTSTRDRSRARWHHWHRPGRRSPRRRVVAEVGKR